MSSKIIWFTGLSGSGKTTLAKKLSKILVKSYKINNKEIKIIDGDRFRKKNRTKKIFSKKNIIKNNFSIIRHIGKIEKKYTYVIVAVISPLAKTRNYAKNFFKKKYCEVYLTCKIETLKKRDPKGLYKKVKNMIGVDSKIKYEKTNYKKITINTDMHSKDKALKILLKKLKIK